ncbi:membrane protein [Microbacterium phage Pumpernickel]|uniref:Membrane protein n=1 Tax=Microbacterium phage Pumpernickel TaxID=2885983 RepID=A0AAE9C2Z5_9CAUD|nr:membrane protein [Microbacterium phage Pumpernickel]UDL15991.1 membrane protein [Microbacterium phage Pumpernickel]
MYFWIIWAVVAAAGITWGILYYRYSYWYQAWYHIFNGIWGGVVAGFFIALIVGFIGANNTLSGNEWVVVEEDELVALATQQETEGSASMLFFVGYAQVDDVRTAYWTTRDDEGIIEMKSQNAESIRVREVETQPKYIVESRVDDGHVWLPWDVWGMTNRKTLEIPEGTITQNYEFQP